MSLAVQATDLARRFGKRWALARLDLEVPEGQRLLVFGANGSGKTTLLRVLSTLLSPSTGQLKLFGREPREDLLAVRGRLGLVTHSAGLYEDLSARDNLAVQARLLGKPVPADILERVGLDGRPDPVRAYSAGMRKRLSFALMLHKEPELVLLDEPFAALDPAGMDDVADLIRDLPGTVIVASHQVERTSALCDAALLLEGGLPRWSGPPTRAWEAWQALHGRKGSRSSADRPGGS